MDVIITFLVIAAVIWLLSKIIPMIHYYHSEYQVITGLSYFAMRSRPGAYGEYTAYMRLRDFEKVGDRFLFNLYVPKEDGTTTEIDVLMITPCGIFVIESKDYSGWIFGDEKRQEWTQSLPRYSRRRRRPKCQKERFYNPILQNKGHIFWLNKLLGKTHIYHSVVVFSDRCEFKKIPKNSGEYTITTYNRLFRTVLTLKRQYTDAAMTPEEMDRIYRLLLPLTSADAETRARHIENIRNRKASRPAPKRRRATPTSAVKPAPATVPAPAATPTPAVKPVPVATEPAPAAAEPAPVAAEPAPVTAEPAPAVAEPAPVAAEPASAAAEPAPVAAEPAPVAAEPAPVTVEPAPVAAEPAPVAAEPAPVAERKKFCPQCGGRLVERTATKGERAGKKFLGCSNFPRCRFLENLPD